MFIVQFFTSLMSNFGLVAVAISFQKVNLLFSTNSIKK
jgi:hypothetical protein